MEEGTIAGTVVAPFLTEGYEGMDLNDARDWWYAEHLVSSGAARLPAPAVPPYVPAAGALPGLP
jgi:CMP-N,N'-diacetyllegionaminic acid synthase